VLSTAELDAAEARLAELRRRQAAGLLTEEERREMEALERKLVAHNAAKAKGIMSADEVDVAEARLADLKRRAAAGELTEEERREMVALERQLATHRTAKAASAAAKGMMSSDELDAAEARLADLRSRKAAGLLTEEERRELTALERKLSAHRTAVANALMGADEMAEAEARLADLKRRAAAGELTEEERAEFETLERRLAAHVAALEAKGVMSTADVVAAEARLADLKRRAAAGELTEEERREMEALERKLVAHNAAKAKGIMSADEVDVAEARLADLKRRAAAGELTEEERREMVALERKLVAHNAAKAKGIMSADEVDVAEARLADLKRRAAAGELTEEERREMEALERKLVAHNAAKAKGIMSADEVDVAEARLADLKRRAAAGELTEEERREMVALERQLATHNAASGGSGVGGKRIDKSGGVGGSGGGGNGGSGKGAKLVVEAREDPNAWLKQSKIFGPRLAAGGHGLFDTEETLVDGLEADWRWAKQNNLEVFIAKNDASGKMDPEGAVARVKGVMREFYGLILSVFYYYASATSDLDVYSIGINEFNTFIIECELAVPDSTDCAKPHLEQIFIAVDSGQKIKESFNSKHALSRQEFLQVLVRIAAARYIKPRKRGLPPLHSDLSLAIRELVTNVIAPRVDPAALQVSNDFRSQMVYIRETDEVLSAFMETLELLYAIYSDGKHDLKDVTADSKKLGIEEWLSLCDDLELIDDEFTLREARLCFLWSRMRVADESDAAQRRAMCNLRIEDFYECLVRLATMKRPSSDCL
jgi:hypothetical protein